MGDDTREHALRWFIADEFDRVVDEFIIERLKVVRITARWFHI